jgi:ABC-type multidrug transport system ATPase subunit
MKQRLRLGLALLSDTPAVLLDEPVSNLDKRSIAWYNELVNTYRKDRLIVVASNNQTDEYAFCDTQIHIEDFKPA